ncbi:MAG: AAA family ATPase [bacterium]|nr:AAA family ATPase [bacterium]
MLTGARQTGKTELIKRLFPGRKYVSLDDPFIEEQANDNPQMFMMLNKPPVVYDEVQCAPGLFRYIKIACDESRDKSLFCLSGSQPLELMARASESLAGRVGIIELSTMSQREIDGDPPETLANGAVICQCPQPGMLRDNILAVPVWYV